MNWLIIGLLIVAIFALARIKYMKHKFFLITLFLLALFFYITVSTIISKEKIDFTSLSGIETAGKLYFNWLTHAFSNVKSITANAVKMNWQTNNTIS